jgi:hypothetical protein
MAEVCEWLPDTIGNGIVAGIGCGNTLIEIQMPRLLV